MIHAHPFEILNHCAKHGYLDLADKAAEKSLSHSLQTAVRKLTAPDVLKRWACLLFDSFSQPVNTYFVYIDSVLRPLARGG